MKTSVLIAAYNCSKTIQATLESVFSQTTAPDEVILLNDGSTDETLSVIEPYKTRVSILSQQNSGVSATRNTLSGIAKGDLVAFIDADDVWHPKYLETQCNLFKHYPDAVAFFTGHVNFNGFGSFAWDGTLQDKQYAPEVIDPLSFIERYNATTGMFASMSYMAIPKNVFEKLGDHPFCEKVPGVEDSFLCTTLPLLGPVVFLPEPLVAYRVTPGSLSTLRLERFAMWVDVFTILESQYESQPNKAMVRAFRKAYASKRRGYAKILMGAGEAPKARAQLWRAMTDCNLPSSIAKSMAILCLSCLPRLVQPKWPSRFRD